MGDERYGDDFADKIDLFCWSTSANNFGVFNFNDEWDCSGNFVDWGANKIGNDAPNTWRTLTKEEWQYVVWDRPNASSLRGTAQVNGVNGVMLLPDDWSCPSDIIFKSSSISLQTPKDYANNQTFTADQWSRLEAAGAVFLPAAGCGTVWYVRLWGYYWSATERNADFVYVFYFFLSGMDSNSDRYTPCSVRLVEDF